MSDRPDFATSAAIELALLMPRRQAAFYMSRAHVPLAVIARVLDQRGRRRATDFLCSMGAGQRELLAADTRRWT